MHCSDCWRPLWRAARRVRLRRPRPRQKNRPTADAHPAEPHVRIQSEPFGDSKDGLPITRYLFSNDKGMAVSIIDYGATVTEIDFPDRNKKATNITLGFPTHRWLSRQSSPTSARSRPLCESDRQGQIQAQRQGIHAGDQRPAQLVCMAESNRSATSSGTLARPRPPPSDGKSAGVELMYESRDGEEGYPGRGEDDGDLHAQRYQRAADRLSRRLGRTDRDQPDRATSIGI